MVEPEFTTVRRGAGRSVMMECRVLQANPSRILTFEWHFRGKVLSAGRLDSPGYVSSHRLPAVAADDYGQYTCTLQNEAGAGTCVFHLTGRALPPEFYFDTPSPVRVQRPWLYSYLLQWTQSSPEAADIITAYHLEVRQVDEGAWHSATVPLSGVVRSGDLFSHSISELIVPLAYDIRLSALTRFGLGETATRHIYYTDVINPQQGDIFCGFEDNKMCGFTQYSTRNTTMNFSWVQLPAAQTNKGAHSHNSGLMGGEKEQFLWSHPRGQAVFIEATGKGHPWERAWLISPVYNSTRHVSHTSTLCLSFFFQRQSKNPAVPVGVLRLRVRSLSRRDVLLWSSGLRGEDRHWQPISVSFTPHGPFRLVFEAVRGSGTYGRLLVDDISIMEGFCHHAASGTVTSTARSRMAATRSRITILLLVLIVSFTQR
uniref:Uncharacterized protein n=1 Tax=Eptatretus burgeri TaxID=7764 RepID=A0A8C4R5W5_EPTBU